MKKKLLIFVVVLTFLAGTIGPISVTAESTGIFYVSPSGNDANAGTIDSPFATIKKAQEAVRTLSSVPAGGAKVILREGTYTQKESLKFTKEDSGTPENPIIYQAYNNEKVSISGAAKLDSKKWTAVTDETAKVKIPKEALANVKQMDISKDINGNDIELAEIYDLQGSSMPWKEDGMWNELVFDHQFQDMSRYPNFKSYIKIKSVITEGEDNVIGAQFTCSDDILKTIKDEKNIFSTGWYNNDYWASFKGIKSVDPETGTVTTNSVIYTSGTMKKVRADGRFYFENSLYFIDSPGEYYIDRDKKLMFFYPTKDTNTADVELTAIKGDLIKMDNAENIIFRNLTIESGRKNGFETNNCKNIIIDSCNVRNFGACGINFWDGQDCQVVNSEISFMGNRGINLRGGDPETLTSSGFKVINNKIHDLGTSYNFQPSAWYCHGGSKGGTVGVYAAHNEIYNNPSMAIMGSIESIIEYNDIYNVAYEIADYAAYYSGGVAFGNRGSILRYNYIHDNPSYFGDDTGYGANGIYIDGGNGVTVYGNIVSNIHRHMMYISAGRENVIKNNIFIGNPNASAYKVWPKSAQSMRFACYNADLSLDEFKQSWASKSFCYESPAWLAKYPEIAASMKDGSFAEPNNTVEGNLLFNCGPMDVGEAMLDSDKTSIKNNWETTEDPGFVDAKNGNYQLKADAAVLKKIPGFEIVDMSKIGLLNEPVKVGPSSSTEPEPAPVNNNQSIVNSKIKSAVVLQLDSPNALKNGQKVLVDSENPSVAPVVIDDRTLVPVRFISEAFGAKVGWKESTQGIAIVLGKQTIIMKLGSNVIKNGSEEKTMDVSAQTIQDRTFIPLRALVETLGKQVFWDDKGIIVISDTPNIFDSQKDGEQIDLLVDMTK